MWLPECSRSPQISVPLHKLLPRAAMACLFPPRSTWKRLVRRGSGGSPLETVSDVPERMSFRTPVCALFVIHSFPTQLLDLISFQTLWHPFFYSTVMGRSYSLCLQGPVVGTRSMLITLNKEAHMCIANLSGAATLYSVVLRPNPNSWWCWASGKGGQKSPQSPARQPQNVLAF